MKRDSDTGTWEDVGDDVAREKASQVLRDAVALLPEEKERDATTEPLPIDSVETKPYPSAVASVPVSVDESERAQSAYAQRPTPPMLAHHATELPVPTPVTSYRKRRRHYYGYEGYQPEEVHSPIHSPTRRRYAYHHHHHSYPQYHSQSATRRPHPPPHYYDPYGRHPGEHMEPTLPLSHSELTRQHHHQTNRPPAVSAGARQASTASAQSLLGQLESGMNEFDLFNGELIESDHEEQKRGRATPRGSL